MPTPCSACDRTSGKCKGCTGVDAAIREHPNMMFRAHMLKALAQVIPSPEPAAQTDPPPSGSTD